MIDSGWNMMADTASSKVASVLQDEIRVPKSMVDALEFGDPYQALLALSVAAEQKAKRLSLELSKEVGSIQIPLPDLLQTLPNLNDVESHPVATSIACADSILHSLTKIASGGSQTSQEIKVLEQEKRDMEEHAQDVETALILRKSSDVAAQSLSASKLEAAATAIADYIQQKQWDRLTDRAKAYAGEYTVTQLESTQAALQSSLLEQYQKAVSDSDLMTLGKLTPLVQMVQIEKEAVSLYLRFLKGALAKDSEQKFATAEAVPECPVANARCVPRRAAYKHVSTMEVFKARSATAGELPFCPKAE